MASKHPWLVQGVRRGRTYHFGNRRITPMAYVLRIRWPGGGWLWQTPWAVEVVHDEAVHDEKQKEKQDSVQRLPIRNITGIVKLLLILGAALFLIALWRSYAGGGDVPRQQTRR